MKRTDFRLYWHYLYTLVSLPNYIIKVEWNFEAMVINFARCSFLFDTSKICSGNSAARNKYIIYTPQHPLGLGNPLCNHELIKESAGLFVQICTRNPADSFIRVRYRVWGAVLEHGSHHELQNWAFSRHYMCCILLNFIERVASNRSRHCRSNAVRARAWCVKCVGEEDTYM